MIFQKSASTLSRSSLAATSRAQNFWGTSPSQQSQSVPGFFVSTPQFTRHQQTQTVPYQEDARGAGSSGPHSESSSIGNPYLALTGGANLGPAAPAPPALEDERKEDALAQRRPSARALHLVAEVRHDATTEPMRTEFIVRDPIAEIIDDSAETNVIDGMMSKMQRLQAAGSHGHVLATFEAMEMLWGTIPVEAYNIALASLASTSDVSILLEAYEKMLSRQVRPNTQTYTIVVNSLVSAASHLSAKRAELRPFIGTEAGVLESVDEIMETLAVEEHLILAAGLLQAVVAVHAGSLAPELQASLNAVVVACIDHGVDIPAAVLSSASQSLVALISAQTTIEAAAEQFSALDPEQQTSEEAQLAMLRAYFKQHEPRGAIAFFEGCGSPKHLVRPLLTGFASIGMVGTARRWVQHLKPEPSVIGAVLRAIPQTDAKEHLPSATQLFYEHVASSSSSPSSSSSSSSDNGHNDARIGFLRLCVKADDLEALYMGLRESHLGDALLDPITVSEVVDYLSLRGEPMLAADLFAWQYPKLSRAWSSLEVTSFLGQEMASDAVRAFQQREQLSLSVALRMLPYVMSSAKARGAVFDVVAAARLGAPHEIAELCDSETLAGVVTTLAEFLTRAMGTADGEQALARKLILLFVEDALAVRCEFSDSESSVVTEALLSVDAAGPLVALWQRRHPEIASLHEHSATKDSVAIQRYAQLPYGVDSAVQLLKDQIRLRKTVTAPAIGAVFQACARNDLTDTMLELYTSIPKTRLMLNAVILASASTHGSLARRAVKDLKALGFYADLPTYIVLIATTKDADEALQFFNEAKFEAKLALSPQVFNNTVNILARNLKHAEAANLLNEMKELSFDVDAATWGSIISMHVRLNEGDIALRKLKSLAPLMKSLLEVKTFNHLMHYFVHKKADRAAALEVFMELRATGTLATPYTYRLLMEAYLLLNQTEQASLANADKVLALMRHDGAPITTMCFATLLRARGVLFKDFDGARNFYRGLVKNSRVLPDQNIFKALIESYVTNGHQAETPHVFDEMRKYHVMIDKDMAKLAGEAV